MDAITQFVDWLLRTLGNLNLVVQSFLFRMTLVLGFACALPALAFIKTEVRSQLLQRLLFIVGIFTGCVVPINWLIGLHPKAKSYALVICILAVIFLPLVIPFFVARTAGGEAVLRRGIVVSVVVLFLINLLFA